jgi:hypothetical protein
MVIRRIGVWSAARLYGGMSAVMGLLLGACFAVIAMVGGGMAAVAESSGTGTGLASGMLGAMFGVGAIIILPLFYGVLGIIMGALTAALYNLFAGMFGGIEMDIQ